MEVFLLWHITVHAAHCILVNYRTTRRSQSYKEPDIYSERLGFYSSTFNTGLFIELQDLWEKAQGQRFKPQ